MKRRLHLAKNDRTEWAAQLSEQERRVDRKKSQNGIIMIRRIGEEKRRERAELYSLSFLFVSHTTCYKKQHPTPPNKHKSLFLLTLTSTSVLLPPAVFAFSIVLQFPTI